VRGLFAGQHRASSADRVVAVVTEDPGLDSSLRLGPAKVSGIIEWLQGRFGQDWRPDPPCR
jgi:hypothetical protein